MKDYLDYRESKLSDDGKCDIVGNYESSYYGTSSLPENPVTTMAYIPFQTDTTMYDMEAALKNGTAYVNLNKPFLGGKCI